LKAHASFVNGHADAVATFERLAVRLPEVQRIASDALLDARSRGQNIQSLLITPVQRIPRYLLLLESLLSRTPEAHPDHARSSGAVKLVRGIASELNESKRNHDDAKLMFAIALHIDPPVDDLIEPHRRLLLDAVLLDVARQKPYRFVLFSDLLIKLSAKKNVFVGQQGQAQSQRHLLAAARTHSADSRRCQHNHGRFCRRYQQSQGHVDHGAARHRRGAPHVVAPRCKAHASAFTSIQSRLNIASCRSWRRLIARTRSLCAALCRKQAPSQGASCGQQWRHWRAAHRGSLVRAATVIASSRWCCCSSSDVAERTRGWWSRNGRGMMQWLIDQMIATKQ
jgi:hypothetical protein